MKIRVAATASLLLCLLRGIWAGGMNTSFAAQMEAGVAPADLTPPRELTTPVGGYVQRMNRAAEGVHDRVYAKAIVLRAGDQKFVLVTVDIVGFPPPVKRALAKRLAEDGWAQDQILLLPSH